MGVFGFSCRLTVIWILLTYVSYSTAIRCYRCSLTKTNLYLTEPSGLCSEFDYSDRFIVDCPESTFCVKKTYQAKIAGLRNGTDRFCAFQKFETHEIVNREWIPKVIIEEPYAENCTVINDQGLRTGWTEECYCKTDLCNEAPQFQSVGSLTILILSAVIILRNIPLLD